MSDTFISSSSSSTTYTTTTSSMPTLHGASLNYNVDTDTYTFITNDNTEIQVNMHNSTITVNGYAITTDTIKNAIEKIKEAEEYEKIPF